MSACKTQKYYCFVKKQKDETNKNCDILQAKKSINIIKIDK